MTFLNSFGQVDLMHNDYDTEIKTDDKLINDAQKGATEGSERVFADGQTYREIIESAEKELARMHMDEMRVNSKIRGKIAAADTTLAQLKGRERALTALMAIEGRYGKGDYTNSGRRYLDEINEQTEEESKTSATVEKEKNSMYLFGEQTVVFSSSNPGEYVNTKHQQHLRIASKPHTAPDYAYGPSKTEFKDFCSTPQRIDVISKRQNVFYRHAIFCDSLVFSPSLLMLTVLSTSALGAIGTFFALATKKGSAHRGNRHC